MVVLWSVGRTPVSVRVSELFSMGGGVNMIRSTPRLVYMLVRTFTMLREFESSIDLYMIPNSPQESVLYLPPLAGLDINVDDRPWRRHPARGAIAQVSDSLSNPTAFLQTADTVFRA